MTDAATPTRKLQGFATFSPEKRRRVASMGGQAAARAGTGHRWTSAAATAAGRKGGVASGEHRRRIDDADTVRRVDTGDLDRDL